MFYDQSPVLNRIGATLVDWIGTAVADISPEDFALTLIVQPGPNSAHPKQARGQGFSYRGNVPFYPCSVVKMFILVALHTAYEAGERQRTAELDRAAHDMIKWSSNTATNYIIDILSGTTGDTELAPDELECFAVARGGLNRSFAALGWPEMTGINLSQKLMDDDRYGREKQFVQRGGNNHNVLTTDASASLLSRMMSGTMISTARDEEMASLLARPRDKAFVETPGAQVLNYLGAGLPAGAPIWSKAGWTQWTRDPLASFRRHDVVHTTLSTGSRMTLAVFTQGQRCAMDLALLPQIGREAWRIVDSASL